MPLDLSTLGPLAGALIKAGAPTLGSVVGSLVGGPFGGLAGNLAGTVLGDVAAALGAPADAPPEVIRARIEADPPAATAALAPLESDYELEIADRQSARRQTVDLARAGSDIAWGAPVVSVLAILCFFAVVAMAMFGHTMETPNGGIIIGTATAGYATVLAYWLGSSSSSRRYGDTVRAIASAALPTARPGKARR